MRFNVGNTGASVVKYLANKGVLVPGDYEPERVIIDVKDISQLREISTFADGVVFGAAVSITDVIETLRAEEARRRRGGALSSSAARSGSAFEQVARHLTRVGGKQVRNAGSWAGNVAVALKYNGFASDVVVSFVAAGATVRVLRSTGEDETLSMEALYAGG
jgi:CO/xanthine dehydrogenase FAD-binding subunit